jgi:hypothetical protein
MKPKEVDNMKEHRVVSLALGLIALLGLSAPEARAGNVTISLTWSGGSLAIDFTSPFAQLGGSANSVDVETDTLNAFLAGNKSNLMFTALEADSNNPGASSGADLHETGNVEVSGAGGDTTMRIAASQSGFMSPSGAGTLASSATANYSSAPTGSQTSTSALDATVAPTLTFISTGSGPNSHSSNTSVGATGSASGYTLGSTAFVSLTGSPTGGSDQLSITSKFTAVAVPEPASLVLMLTGLPLPLVVLGLLRRRRAAA